MSTTRKRITFLITDLQLGGTPLLLSGIARGLAGRGFQVSIVSLKAFPAKSVSAFDHSLFEFDSSFGVRGSIFPIPIYSLNLDRGRDFLRGISKLARLLGQIRPDFLFSLLIHANLLATFTAPFLYPKPILIHSIHTLQDTPRWHWSLQGVLSPFADAVVVPAQPILDKISKYGHFKSGIVIPNGIDVERFASAVAIPARELPWPEGAKVIGYVGRFDPVKNLPLLLRAFARLRGGDSLHLALVGYGPQLEELRNLSKVLHIAPRTHFLPRTQMPERFYKSFTCHCLPSSIEGFGLTLVEAMAAGIPVIAPKTAVTESIVRDPFDGKLFIADDELSLTHALKSLMIDPPIVPPTTILPPSTLSHVREHFSDTKMVARYAEFFNNFCR